MPASRETIRCWSWSRYYGRQGTLESLFFASGAEVEAMVGIRVAFDEPFGKHSFAEVLLERKDFTVVDLSNVQRVLAGHDLFALSTRAREEAELYEDAPALD